MSNTSFPSDNTPFSQWWAEQSERDCELELDLDLALELEMDDDFPMDLMLPADTPLEDQLAVDRLLDEGFSWVDALSLLRLRTGIMENPEMHEHPSMQFAQWLYQHGRLSDDLA